MATLGTSSSHPDVIAELHDAGTDIFRLDFGHGSPYSHGERCRTIQALNTGSSRPAGILGDLQGARFRLGLIIGGFVSLCAGGRLRLDLDPAPGNRQRIPLPQPEFFEQARPGDEIVIDGGAVRLLITSATPDHAETIVLAGGYVSDARRVAVPASVWPVALTEKDRADAVFAAALGVEWLAVPASCGVGGMAEIRSLIGTSPRLMVRLDNCAAIGTIAEVLAVADGILFARHDLALSRPRDALCRLQKKLFMECSASGKMLVCATQALAEYGHGPVPDAAHIHSHSHAVFEEAASALGCGAHVLMLSSVSASGAFPVESVARMERFIRTAECGINPEDMNAARAEHAAMPGDDILPFTARFNPPEAGKQLPRTALTKRSCELRAAAAGLILTPQKVAG